MGVRPERDELRLLTYLAPGLPLQLFEACAREIGLALGLGTMLASDPTRSAPAPDEADPFRGGEADVGFLCAPGYVWLSATEPPAVELVPAAFVFDDPRGRGRPVYFADVIVSQASSARRFDDLRGLRWVYNDPSSLSGYFSVLAELEGRGEGPEFFSSVRAVGSHHAALAAVEKGAADCAAIDSNTLLQERRRGVQRRVRVVASLGPFPVQPIVVSNQLPAARKQAIAGALLHMHTSEPGRAALERCGVRRLAPVSAADYEPERRLLARSGALACPAALR